MGFPDRIQTPYNCAQTVNPVTGLIKIGAIILPSRIQLDEAKKKNILFRSLMSLFILDKTHLSSSVVQHKLFNQIEVDRL